MRGSQQVPFDTLLGLTLMRIDGAAGDEDVRFYTDRGREFVLYHDYDCCEQVRVEEIDGDPADLIGHPLLMAEEVSDADGPAPPDEYSYTWTFYKLATIRGYVTIRFLGTSNGYYSERVDFAEIIPTDPD